VIRASFGKTTAGRLLLGAGALALLVPAIAGCEAGADAPTLEFHPASAGSQTVFNGIRISDAFVLGAPAGSTVPSGSSAGLFLSIYNGSANADELMSATAQGAATSVAVTGTTVALPVDSAVDLTGPQPSVVLNSLTKPLTGGSSIPVTLDFQHAGSVTLQVPVEPQSYYYSTYSAPAPAATTAAPTATGTAAATKSATSTASATPSS
jgi:copper(I)-binding protein